MSFSGVAARRFHITVAVFFCVSPQRNLNDCNGTIGSRLLSPRGEPPGVHAVRKFLSLLFGILSLMRVSIAFGGVLRIIHRHYSGLPFRASLVSIFFLVTAALFAMAFMTGWRGQGSSKGWDLPQPPDGQFDRDGYERLRINLVILTGSGIFPVGRWWRQECRLFSLR